MYEHKTSNLHLMKENQELKIEITQLRNAFDLNKEVLNILSIHQDVSKRHFYVMLKKLNEYVYDLSEHQIQTRRERKQKQIRIKELEDIIENQREQEKKKGSKNIIMELERMVVMEKTIIEPKQSHILMMEQIKKMARDLSVSREECSKLKMENLQLRRKIKKYKGCSNCQYDTSTFQENSSPQREEGSKHVKYHKVPDHQSSSHEQQYINRIQKLTRVNNHLNNSIQLITKGIRTINKTKKYFNQEYCQDSNNLLIQLINARVDMECLDYPNLYLRKRQQKGKSV